MPFSYYFPINRSNRSNRPISNGLLTLTVEAAELAAVAITGTDKLSGGLFLVSDNDQGPYFQYLSKPTYQSVIIPTQKE